MNSAESNRFTHSYRSGQSVGNILVRRPNFGFDFNMRPLLLLCSVLVISTSAFSTEAKLDAAAIRELLSDTTYVSSDDNRPTEQVFQASGATFTIDVATKALSQGFWRIQDDKYCSVWPPSEHWSCYSVLKTDQGVVFVSSSGTRYEMKMKTTAN